VPGLRHESWKALLKIHDEGLARSVGVSNYTIRHLEELLPATPIPPAVNQVEFHPFLYQKELLEFCVKQRIHLEAYSPLTRGHRLNHPIITQVAAKYARTPAQVLIRWSLQHGLVVIPKSIRADRIRENAAVFDFDLKREDMERLDSLDEGSRVAWNPEDLPRRLGILPIGGGFTRKRDSPRWSARGMNSRTISAPHPWRIVEGSTRNRWTFAPRRSGWAVLKESGCTPSS